MPNQDYANACEPTAPLSGSTSSSLLERVKMNEPEAWRRLVKLYAPVVYGWVRGSGLQAQDASDVVQDVFAAVVVAVGQFRANQPGDSFRGWLWTITRNKVRDHFRHGQRFPSAPGGSEGQQQVVQVSQAPAEAPSADAAAAERQHLERRAVEMIRAQVEPRTWEAFWCVAVDGNPAVEVARQLGMTVHAVTTRNTGSGDYCAANCPV